MCVALFIALEWSVALCNVLVYKYIFFPVVFMAFEESWVFVYFRAFGIPSTEIVLSLVPH